MPFDQPYAQPSAGDFVYGLYDSNATITYLEGLGCVRVMTQQSALYQAYDPVYAQASGGGNHVIKRYSKLGLHLAAHKNRIVHFVLDGIDLDKVIHRSASPHGKLETSLNRGITGAELRWIYRNQANPQVQRAIQFWHAKAQCSPPWVAGCPIYSDQWSQYHPKAIGKSLVDLSAVDLAPNPAIQNAPPTGGSKWDCCIIL